MRTYCEHEECEPYGGCQAATPRERTRDFWDRRWIWNLPTDQLGTDPLAWLDGAVPDE